MKRSKTGEGKEGGRRGKMGGGKEKQVTDGENKMAFSYELVKNQIKQ